MMEQEEPDDEIDWLSEVNVRERVEISVQGSAPFGIDAPIAARPVELRERALREIQGDHRAAVLEQIEREPTESGTHLEDVVMGLDSELARELPRQLCSVVVIPGGPQVPMLASAIEGALNLEVRCAVSALRTHSARPRSS